MIAIAVLTLGLITPATTASAQSSGASATKSQSASARRAVRRSSRRTTRRSYRRRSASARRSTRRSARRSARLSTRRSARRSTRRSTRRTARRSTRRSTSRPRFVRSTQRVSVSAYRGKVRRRAPGTVLHGMASYYWQPQPVASGGRFNPNALTAAHKTLPFGTRVRVTNLNNGRSVVVKINDRGPYIRGRIIDLSRRAATVVGMRASGIAPVRVTVLGR
jgi:rare lipoprotein A